jgi:hypothetical protein
MPSAPPDAAATGALRCDHCGRPVRRTQHTRTDYRVDFYALHAGRGEVCPLIGNYANNGGTYVRLTERFDVITCAQCYRLESVQAERERRFRPERAVDGGEETER